MAIHDLSAKQLEKLVKKLGSTVDAYKESGLYPPPQVISELRRAKYLFEQKKIPPKPDVEHQYNIVISKFELLSQHFADYMDQEINEESFINKLEDLRNTLVDMQNEVSLLQEWEEEYGRRQE